MDIIDWDGLSSNPCPEAIILLKENMDKINWSELSYNTNMEVMELFAQNEDKTDRFNWVSLSRNPGIFKDRKQLINQKIIEFCNEYLF